MKMSDKNFITIQGWMRTELNLSGNDLLVYAIIYGITQDGETEFYASQQYLADWCGCTTRGIRKNLDSLIERGLIQVIEHTIGQTVRYRAVVPNEEVGTKFLGDGNKVPRGSEQSSYKNISNTKEYTNTIPKGIVGETPTETSLSEYEQHMFTEDVRKKRNIVQTDSTEKKTKKSRWEKCSEMIDEYTQDEELRTALRDYLSDRLAMKDKPIYANQWKGLLNRLTELSATEDPIKVVKQSIERAYGGFFPVKEYGNYNRKPNPSVFGEHERMSSKKVTKEEREEIMRNGKVF